MYKVITYHDRNGNDEVATYIRELNVKMATSKDARIHYDKIMKYIGYLKTYGLAVGMPTIKHINETELWELRPIDDRIFFVYWKDDTFVLLHHFVKKSQKTPRREIEQANRNLKDFLERYGD
ncbi:MAG: type II toxin-antitoxin system RelE/ParE family toxin [Oscillospiraceae bacterium]|nr:type II toxin-antitoxin system RelE/ParE family toxin [Oscillospiraceae bacterium]